MIERTTAPAEPTDDTADALSERPRTTSRHRAVAVAIWALAGGLGLGACGTGDITPPVTTVTVTPSDTPQASDGATATPSEVPTVAGTTPTGPAGVPTALAAGKQRGAPHSYAEAKARIDTAAASAVGATFQSPTGNISCSLSADAVTAACEVGKGRIAPPLPTICPAGGAKDIGRIELSAAGAFPVCNSDTIRDPAAPKLAYGARASLPGSPYSCVSESFGTTCVDSRHRHGFFLARDTFVTF